MRKIAINIIATNRYVSFLNKLCESIENYFPKDSEITVIVYTNIEIPSDVFNNKIIRFIKSQIVHEPWPASTLKRFEYFLGERDTLLESDYCYYIDADSVFIDNLDDSIYPESGMVGTLHPCLYGSIGTPDRNPNSKAYIPYGANNKYYCGGFFGGKSSDFVSTAEIINSNIVDDSGRGVLAIWHDESHLNKYFYENPPAVTLEHPFAIAENLTARHDGSKVMFLDKTATGGHDFYRS